MKISSAAVLAIVCIPSSVAFVTTSNQKSRSAVPANLQLNLQKDDDENGGISSVKGKISWAGPAMTTVAGLTLASQMAGASMAPPTVAATGTTPIIREGKYIQQHIHTHTHTHTNISKVILCDIINILTGVSFFFVIFFCTFYDYIK
jgi:hypothetical protein